MTHSPRKLRLRPGTRRTVLITLLGSFALIYVLVRNAQRTPSVPVSTELLSVAPLHQAYLHGGMNEYMYQKQRLKNNVALLMKHNEILAAPIAVFLFPDLLPDNDFEKQVAYQEWFPLQVEIESNPGTEKSRKYFEALKASIWIYENPDQRHPAQSETAEAVVRLYDEMSRVR